AAGENAPLAATPDNPATPGNPKSEVPASKASPGGRPSDLESLVADMEDKICRGLGLKALRIIPFYPEPPEGAAERVGARIGGNAPGPVEADDDVAALGGDIAYGLTREGKLLGLMIVSADPGTLISDKRAVLEVLAGQVAVGIESAILIEEKLRLEREL